MKKSLYFISFLILLIVVFWGGARFNQRGAGPSTTDTVERQILHYVDPMNPAHTSKEPGIAPCGMPMEPVYADMNTPGVSGIAGSAFSTSPGTVKINLQKQQIIGVQIGEVTRSAETYTIRALGRIAPDENRIYPLIAATDGWLGGINESTTGSLVKKDQILARIKVYNADFLTWQQKYLTELLSNKRYLTDLVGGSELKNISLSNLSGPEQARIRRFSGRQSETPTASAPQGADEKMHSMTESTAPETPSSTPNPEEMVENVPTETPYNNGTTPAVADKPSVQPGEDHSAHRHIAAENDKRPVNTPPKKPPYISAAKQSLLGLGVAESQLTEFEKSYTYNSQVYLTHIDVRSPVDGLVLSRKVSPFQRIDRGVECFTVVDLGRVWIVADIYDMEAKSIQPGTPARISMPKQNKQFTATVSAIPPRFDAITRSLKVRLEMDNPGNVLRPDMFVDIEFLVPLAEAITVPTDAVIDSGIKKTVYVAMEKGLFEPRAVKTGWRSNDRVEIVAGLQPGEKIVVAGNFLIDSESRMKQAAARLMEDPAEQVPEAHVTLPAVTPQPAATLQLQPTPPALHKEATAGAAAQMSEDPVCGMTINQDQAMKAGLIVEVEGKTYYFCSAACKEQFEQNSQDFLGKQTDQPMQSDAHDHEGHKHD